MDAEYALPPLLGLRRHADAPDTARHGRFGPDLHNLLGSDQRGAGFAGAGADARPRAGGDSQVSERQALLPRVPYTSCFRRCTVTGWNRQMRRVLAVIGLAAVLAIAGVAAQNARPAAAKYPPQFPREGATK